MATRLHVSYMNKIQQFQNQILELLYFTHIRNMQPGDHHQHPLT